MERTLREVAFGDETAQVQFENHVDLIERGGGYHHVQLPGWLIRKTCYSGREQLTVIPSLVDEG